MSPPSPFGRAARFAVLVLSLASVATACRMPNLDIPLEARPLPQNSVIYAADGTRITTLHAEEDRVILPLERIPKVVQDAVIAVEDQRFWTHRGVDLRAMLRAAVVNASEGRIVEGGSTITQQYVKNAILGSERTLDRKVREATVAWRLERTLSKAEILERYLNTIYFGNGAYGVQSAARRYFSKRGADLRLREAALLAGLIAGPERYDPFEAPAAALQRRNLVLDRMLAQGMIAPQAHAEAVASPLGLEPPAPRERYPAAHFVEFVKKRILSDERFGATREDRYNALFKGGLRIHTTVDPRLQRAADEAVNGILSQKGDPHGALTAIDPRTGRIVAMVGGRDFFAKRKRNPVARVNLATGDGGTGRQAGSSFKPFALVAALENGMSPKKRYPGGSSIAIPMAHGSPWLVRNYEGGAFGSLDLEQATIHSVNVVYARLIMEVGAHEVVDTAKRMGIRSRLRALPSAVLGANEVNTLEMASAYGTLATNGLHVQPVAIERVTDAEGRVLFEAEPRERQAVPPAVAWVTTQILRKVILQGTGIAANIGRPAAGKTGTAQQWRDAWFAGYVPQLSAAVWVGFPQGAISMVPPTTRTRVTGGSFPAQIWQAFMTRATKGMPVRNFRKPDATEVTVAIDRSRGCVADAGADPASVEMVTFVAGTEPKRCSAQPVAASAPTAPGLPAVVGMPLQDAVQVLVGKGYTTSNESEYHPGYPRGTVIRQYPGAGSDVPRGARVHLIVATQEKPYVVVPKVTGLTEREAKAKLRAAGFAVAIRHASKRRPGEPTGVVLSQDPAAGAERPSGATVTIILNPPPSPSPSPSPS